MFMTKRVWLNAKTTIVNNCYDYPGHICALILMEIITISSKYLYKISHHESCITKMLISFFGCDHRRTCNFKVAYMCRIFP